MKKIKIVYHQNGENSGTTGPLCPLSEFTGNLDETCERFVSWDCDILITVKKYSVAEITVPDWMNEAEFINRHIELRFADGLGFPVLTASETAFNNFTKIEGEKKRYFICWLLKKYANTKNNFMRSIYDQVTAWLETAAPKYDFPLSVKQYEAAAKFCPLWEAKRINTKTYYSY